MIQLKCVLKNKKVEVFKKKSDFFTYTILKLTILNDI